MAEGLIVQVAYKLEDPDWDTFVLHTPFGHHVQTSLWGQVKSTRGYRAIRIIAYEQGKIVAGGQLLIRRIFPLMAIGYMPKGPLYPPSDPSLVEPILDQLQRVIKSYHLQYLAVQPANDSTELVELLAKHGFQTGSSEFTPTATILLDLTSEPEKILAQMNRHTRRNIHRSECEGITIREGTQDDLPTFYRLYIATSQRQKFTPYPEMYFTHMWQVFAPHGYVSLILAEYAGEIVSALLSVPFGDTVVAKMIGWSGQYPERKPNDAVYWGAIRWAKSNLYRRFDFGGIDRRGAEFMVSGQPQPEELKHTRDFFKVGFGGQVVLLPKSLELIASPLLRWPYRIIFGKTDHGHAANELLRRFRRRFR